MNRQPESLADLTLLFVDCQTTGATPENGHLLEIAWQLRAPQTRESQQTETRLLRLPGDTSLPRRIAKLTGITAEEINDSGVAPLTVQQDFSEALKQATVCDTARHVCVAHYARFEQRFIDALLEEDPDNPVHPHFICSYELARRLLPELPRHTIRALAGYFGFSLGELRRASHHVTATAAIWSGLTGLLKDKGITTLDETLRLLAEPAPRPGQVEFPIDREQLADLPRSPGIYRFIDRNEKVLYVGKATELRSRVRSYFRPKGYQASRTREMLTQVIHIQTQPAGSPLEAALLEIDEIQRRNPPYNTSLRVRSPDVFFLSRATSEITNSADPVDSIGPFPSERGPATLRTLAHLWTSPGGANELLEETLWVLGADDSLEEHLSLIEPAVCGLHEILGSPRETSDIYDTLLAQSAALWPWYSARDTAPDEDADDEPEQPPEDWTLPRVSRRIVGALVHAGRLSRRALWLKLLEQLELHYTFNDNPLSFSPAQDPAWTGLTSRGGYDRAVVLTGEVRALLRRGTFCSLRGPADVQLAQEQTATLVGWF